MKVDAGNTKSIDLLNIGLIILSLIVAFKIPFELFLFSYAVLGPLHYLTEINWLEGRNYFVKERKWIWVMVLMALLMTVPVILRLPALKFLNGGQIIKNLYGLSQDIFYSILLVTLVFSLTLVYVKKWQHILLLLIANLVATVVILKYKLFTLSFLGMFLPTILHVYLFTLLFMVYGTIKSKNRAGLISCLLLLACPFVIFGSSIIPEQYYISQTVQTTFMKSDFQNVNAYIAKLFGALGPDGKFYLVSEMGIKIQIFIAFCYTYHYLNWFSKTSVIGWGKNITKGKLAAMLAIWACSVALYWYDYKIGFAALFTISLVHVFFEFPLNVISVQGIFTGIFGKAAK
jgi:hypothetical protein